MDRQINTIWAQHWGVGVSESFADAGSSWIDRVLTEGSGLSKGTEMHSGSPGPGPGSGENRSSESGQMPTAHPPRTVPATRLIPGSFQW